MTAIAVLKPPLARAAVPGPTARAASPEFVVAQAELVEFPALIPLIDAQLAWAVPAEPKAAVAPAAAAAASNRLPESVLC